MKRDTPIVIRPTQIKFTGIIPGPVRVIHPAIKRVGCVWQYDRRRHAFLVPIRHLDAVLIEIERGNVKAIVEYSAAQLW